jgi:hypothetical protein
MSVLLGNHAICPQIYIMASMKMWTIDLHTGQQSYKYVPAIKGPRLLK